MDEYYTVIESFPEPLRSELRGLEPEIAARVQEVRLRRGQPVQFTIGGRLRSAREVLPCSQAACAVGQQALQQCFLTLCRYSAYAYEDELRQGFFTLPDGCRVGVAGVKGPHGFAVVTSLNLRVSRSLTCELPKKLLPILDDLRGGVLVAGVPGSGKTTFLRSIIRYLEKSDRVFCVADERGELLPPSYSVHCDVYTRCSKAQAITMALRCMNPQAIICDELGTQADAAAVEEGLASGVVFLASVHCDRPEHLERKPQLARLLHTGAFETVVFLDGRLCPGKAVRVERLA
ncbi:MAG: ATPase, T2SS/T4P/T4SS family [Oscillospiraceae bacterium]|nr:ATPase, T2SS/T4P/T4SS family [Oscillospiraceae bacterium]